MQLSRGVQSASFSVAALQFQNLWSPREIPGTVKCAPTLPSPQLLAPAACLPFQGRLFHVSMFPVGGTPRDRLYLPLFMDVMGSMSYFVFVFFLKASASSPAVCPPQLGLG